VKGATIGFVASVTIVVAAGIVLVALSAAFTNRPDELWLEAGKAGMQLLIIGVLGGLLSAGWQRVTQRRAEERADLASSLQRSQEEADRHRQSDLEEHERRLQHEREQHERQLATFLQVVAAYNGVKAVRRRLKSLGFGDRGSPHKIDSWQASGFHDAMARLSEYQLVFEAIGRELRETRLYSDDSDSIIQDLVAMEEYVKRAVDFWERRGGHIRSGTPLNEVASGVRGIVSYTAFDAGVVAHRQRLTQTMHRHLFAGESSSASEDGRATHRVARSSQGSRSLGYHTPQNGPE
jgi:hypothetical protein